MTIWTQFYCSIGVDVEIDTVTDRICISSRKCFQIKEKQIPSAEKERLVKMKKRALIMMSTAMVMVFAAACSSKNTPSATASETTAAVAETTQQEATKAESTASAESLNTDEAKDSEESKADSAADQEEASMTGTISDIKDFMFTITFDGQDYGFSFDQNEKPQGLDSVKDGDTVMVTYTGTVNTVDAFTGKILSVEKVD